MARNGFRIDLHGLGGIIVLAVVILLAWWLLGALLSLTLGHLLIIGAAGFLGYAIGRARR